MKNEKTATCNQTVLKKVGKKYTLKLKIENGDSRLFDLAKEVSPSKPFFRNSTRSDENLAEEKDSAPGRMDPKLAS